MSKILLMLIVSSGLAYANQEFSVFLHNASSCPITNCHVITSGIQLSCGSVGPNDQGILPDVAPGATVLLGGGVSRDRFSFECNNSLIVSCNGSAVAIVVGQNGVPTSVTVDGSGTGCAGCTNVSGCIRHKFQITQQNTSQYPARAHYELTDAVTGAKTTIAQDTVPSGGIDHFTYDYDGNFNPSWGIDMFNGTGIDGNGNINVNYTGGGGQSINTGSTDPYQWAGPANNFTGQQNGSGWGTNGAFGNQAQTNGPIIFNSSGMTLAHDATLQAGFNVVDADLKMIQVNEAAINAALNHGFSNSFSGGGGITVTQINNSYLTNFTSVSSNSTSYATNVIVTNNIAFSNAPSETGVSNLLGSALATNYPNYTEFGTNGTMATGNARAALANSESKLDAISGGIGNAPDVTGGGGTLQIEFMGQVLDLDPAVRFPGFQSFFYQGMSLAALLSFGFFAAKLIRETVQTFAQAETGGVPDLEATVFGVGGNVLGTIVAIVVATVLIGLWIVAFYFVFDAVLAKVTGLNGLNPFASVSGAALYLLTSFFPISLILSLAWTSISLQIGAAKVVMVAASASRYLFGK